MGVKATFNPISKIIKLTEAPVLIDGEYQVSLDVQVDLYSDMKEDWLNDINLRKYHPPIRAVGGDPLPGSKTLGDTYFLRSDWKIEPYDADQRLTVNGNFYSEDGTSPFIKPSGGVYSVLLERVVSNLVDSTIAQLPEIEFSSYADAVHVDSLNTTGRATSGTDYPIGTLQYPVNNFSDAVAIANIVGLSSIHVISNGTLDALDVSGMLIECQNKETVTLTINAGANVENCVFKNLTITGSLDNDSFIEDCRVQNLSYVDGDLHKCEIVGTLTAKGTLEIHDCYSGTKGVTDPAIIDMDGGGKNVAIHKWSGHIKIINMSSFAIVGIGCLGGAYVEIDSTVTAGMIHLMGNFRVVNNSSGTAVVKTDYVTSPANISTTVWNGAVRTLTSGSATAQEVWEYTNRELTAGTKDSEIDGLVASVDALPILSEIEASSILAKESTLQLIKTKTDGLPSGIQRNQALNNFQFAMISSSDHISFRPLLNISVLISIDGSTPVSSANSVVEIGQGLYKIDLNASELDGKTISLIASAPGADTRIITIVTS